MCGDNQLVRVRKRVGYSLWGFTALALAWMFSPGIPVMWAPRADGATKAAGLALFEHEWQPYDTLAKGDGLGPVFNARSCVACHFQGGAGGGGGNKQNVAAFEAAPTADRPDITNGLIHAFAVENRYLENSLSLRKAFPIVPNGQRVAGDCRIFTRDFDPVRTESVNSTALFGVGWIDRISAKSISHQRLKTTISTIGRELSNDFSGVPPGRYRVLADGRVGKFGWKAQFATLEEFVAAACANEIGLGNPRMPQAKPLTCRDYPDVDRDIDSEQFRSLVAFVDTLSRPQEIPGPKPIEGDRAAHGKVVFNSVGCAICHTPDLGGVTGIYSDFLLHRINDRADGGGYTVIESVEAPIPAEHPKPEEWKTPPLWGVADSAPYFHDGHSPTLELAVDRHKGDADGVIKRLHSLPSDDRQDLYAFLKSLRAPRDAHPAPNPDEATRK